MLNARGNTLMHICSEHDGMGSFTLTPVAGEAYHAILISSDHVTKRFDLPPVRPEGIVLSAVCYKQLILILRTAPLRKMSLLKVWTEMEKFADM